MRYVVAAFVGIVSALVAGCFVGFLMMTWGPGSGDPLSGLWILGCVLVSVPAAVGVALMVVRGRPGAGMGPGAVLRPAALGAALATATALVLFFPESTDVCWELLVVVGVGALAGVTASLAVRFFNASEHE